MASVRPAVLTDAPKVARIGVRAWQAAYQGLMPNGYLDRLSVEQRTASWEQGLARPVEPGHARLVVEDDDGEVAGFVVTGPTRSGEGTGEVRVLNVEPTRWGRGLGQLLLAAGVDELRSAGYAAGILWVVEGNVRARKFYELAGWYLDGGRMVDDRFATGAVEVRYRLELAGTNSGT
jgi:GNAT superfamily N-acetyltransferase